MKVLKRVKLTKVRRARFSLNVDIDPRVNLFRWGPIDGKLIYPDFFNIAFTKFRKAGFVSWPDVLWLMQKEKMTCVVDNKNLYECGRQNFEKSVLNSKRLSVTYRNWRKNLNKWLQLQKTLSSASLRQLSDKDLSDIFQRWTDLYIEFWTLGLLPEVANWGGEVILNERLSKLKLESDSEFILLLEKLAAPEKLSFYQKEKLSLLKIKKQANKVNYGERLARHQKKFFWILNSYHHTKILSEKYFKKEIESIGPAYQSELVGLMKYTSRIKREKQQLINRYHIDSKTAQVAHRLAFCIWWQDLRKYYIFLANYHVDVFLREFSRRFCIDFDDLHYYGGEEIIHLLKNYKKIASSEIKRRKNYLVIHYSEKTNSLKYISGKMAFGVIKKYTVVRVGENITVLTGTVVSRGRAVQARVSMISSAKDIAKVKRGNVLVTAMTAPDYIVAIKRASAIVTDEGGLTCHAAIVSRELGIPCIVGTKVATKVFKEGDLVEVDTAHGSITRLTA